MPICPVLNGFGIRSVEEFDQNQRGFLQKVSENVKDLNANLLETRCHLVRGVDCLIDPNSATE